MIDQLERLEPEPRNTYNVRTSMGFTEIFTEHQIDVLCRLGLIKYESTTGFPDGTQVHFYVRGS